MEPTEKKDKKTSRIRAISVEYVSALSGFMVLAWILGDVPMKVVAAVVAFLLAGCAASVLFDQLSGVRKLPGKSRNVIGVAQSSIMAMFIGAGGAWGYQNVDFGMGIGITLASVAGVTIALTGTAWRQRWSERQLYRESLSPFPTQPET